MIVLPKMSKVLGVLGIGLFSCFAQSASATVWTQVCVLTSDFASAGTNDDLLVTLTGVSGATTREFNFDSPGDDFIRGQWSCFLSSDAGGSGSIRDVGYHVIANLRFSGGDDYCMMQMYTRRWSAPPSADTSNVISTSQFYAQSKYRQCFGDTPSLNSIREKSFDTTSRIPAAEKLKVVGNWVLADTHTGPSHDLAFSRSVSLGSAKTNSKAWSVAISRGVEVETKFGGGGATNSLSVTATTGETNSISSTSGVTETQTSTKPCKANDGKSANLALWQWNVSIRNRLGGDAKLQTAATVCTVNAAGARPKCRPSCFDIATDQSGQTCLKTPEACTVHLK